MATCAECGAVWEAGRDCQGVFDEFLMLEFTDPEYGAVHFLTVATFMLQHGRYSSEALEWVVPTMRAYLAGETSVERIRREARATVSSGTRKWRVMRAPDAPPQRHVAWELTLADVAAQTHDAASYRAAITAWAARAVAQWTASQTS